MLNTVHLAGDVTVPCSWLPQTFSRNDAAGRVRCNWSWSLFGQRSLCVVCLTSACYAHSGLPWECSLCGIGAC